MSENTHKNKFKQSLELLTANDICEQKKKKVTLSSLLFDNLRYIIIAVCAVALVISSVSIFDALRGYAMQGEIYDDVDNMIMNGALGVDMMFASPTVPATPDYNASQKLTDDDIGNITKPTQVNKDYERIKIKLAGLKKMYPDLYGWVTIPGTTISYPIMQADDNDYYLRRSYTGVRLTAGSIFADYRCSESVRDNYNFVIYGHHMRNDSMFGTLDLYLSEAYFSKYNTIYIYTLEGMYTYKFFSFYETDKYYPYIMTYFHSDDDFNDFANEIKEKSLHKTDYKVNGESRIITLSTCNNLYEDGRFALHGVLVDYYEGK